MKIGKCRQKNKNIMTTTLTCNLYFMVWYCNYVIEMISILCNSLVKYGSLSN